MEAVQFIGTRKMGVPRYWSRQYLLVKDQLLNLILQSVNAKQLLKVFVFNVMPVKGHKSCLLLHRGLLFSLWQVFSSVRYGSLKPLLRSLWIWSSSSEDWLRCLKKFWVTFLQYAFFMKDRYLASSWGVSSDPCVPCGSTWVRVLVLFPTPASCSCTS